MAKADDAKMVVTRMADLLDELHMLLCHFQNKDTAWSLIQCVNQLDDDILTAITGKKTIPNQDLIIKRRVLFEERWSLNCKADDDKELEVDILISPEDFI